MLDPPGMLPFNGCTAYAECDMCEHLIKVCCNCTYRGISKGRVTSMEIHQGMLEGGGGGVHK